MKSLRKHINESINEGANDSVRIDTDLLPNQAIANFAGSASAIAGNLLDKYNKSLVDGEERESTTNNLKKLKFLSGRDSLDVQMKIYLDNELGKILKNIQEIQQAIR